MAFEIHGELDPVTNTFIIPRRSDDETEKKLILVAHDLLFEKRGEQITLPVMNKGVPTHIVCTTASARALLEGSHEHLSDIEVQEHLQKMVAGVSTLHTSRESGVQPSPIFLKPTTPTPSPPPSPTLVLPGPHTINDNYKAGDLVYGFHAERAPLLEKIFDADPDSDSTVMIVDHLNDFCGREELARLIDDLLHLIEPEPKDMFRSELRRLSHAEKRERTAEFEQNFERFMKTPANVEKFNKLIKDRLEQPFLDKIDHPELLLRSAHADIFRPPTAFVEKNKKCS